MSLFGFPLDTSPNLRPTQSQFNKMFREHPDDKQLQFVAKCLRDERKRVVEARSKESSMFFNHRENGASLGSLRKTTLESLGSLRKTTLESLPNEILTEVFQYCNNLDFDYKAIRSCINNRWDPTWIHDLCSLSLCNKRMKAIAEPILYSSFYEFRPSQCTKFIRTVLGRPELAQHVLWFDAMVNCEWKMPIDTLVTTFSDTAVTNLQIALATVDGHIDAKDLEETEERKYIDFDRDSAVAIAMLLLPNLRHLSLCIHGRHTHHVGSSKTPFHFITVVVRKALSDPKAPFLQHLETISVEPVAYDIKSRSSHYDQDFGLFGRLSTVKKVVVKGFMLSRFDNKKLRLPAVVDVELRLRCMHFDHFVKFLHCFPALERFSYEQIESSAPCKGYALNRIVQSLSDVKSSLKFLCLKPSTSRDYYRDASQNIQPLTIFQCLEDIDVIAFDKWVDTRLDYNGNRTTLDPRISPMVDILPFCIKRLTLRQASGNTLLHVRGLLEEREQRDRVPNLESVRIILDEHFQFSLTGIFGISDVKPDITHLKQIADNCSITLKVEIHVKETGPIGNIKRDIRRGYGQQEKDRQEQIIWGEDLDIGQLSLGG